MTGVFRCIAMPVPRTVLGYLLAAPPATVVIQYSGWFLSPISLWTMYQ